MVTRVNRFLSFFLTSASMACVFPLCETLIKNINNGVAGGQKACRQLRGNKRVLAQPTIALVRKGEWTYFKYWSTFFIAHIGAIIKKALVLVRCDKAIQPRRARLHCSLKIRNHRETRTQTHSREIKRGKRTVIESIKKNFTANFKYPLIYKEDYSIRTKISRRAQDEQETLDDRFYLSRWNIDKRMEIFFFFFFLQKTCRTRLRPCILRSILLKRTRAQTRVQLDHVAARALATAVSYASRGSNGRMSRTYAPSRILEDLRTEGTQNLLIPFEIGTRSVIKRKTRLSGGTEPNERLGSIPGHGFLDDSSKGITARCCYIDLSCRPKDRANALRENAKR